MILKRAFAMLAVGGVIVASSIAAAAALDVNGLTQQAGSTEDFTCDSSGVTTYVSNYDHVDQTADTIVIEEIDKACQDGTHTVSYVVLDGEGAELADPGAAAIGEGQHTVTATLSVPVAVEEIEQINLAILGFDDEA